MQDFATCILQINPFLSSNSFGIKIDLFGELVTQVVLVSKRIIIIILFVTGSSLTYW